VQYSLFAGYGQEVGMPAAVTCWPRGGGPRDRSFLFLFYLLWLFSHTINCIAPFVVTTVTAIS